MIKNIIIIGALFFIGLFIFITYKEYDFAAQQVKSQSALEYTQWKTKSLPNNAFHIATGGPNLDYEIVKTDDNTGVCFINPLFKDDYDKEFLYKDNMANIGDTIIHFKTDGTLSISRRNRRHNRYVINDRIDTTEWTEEPFLDENGEVQLLPYEIIFANYEEVITYKNSLNKK